MSTKNIQCKKRKIVVWIISIGIIAALFFGISKFISYRTMPPFAAEREALEIDYGDYLEIDGFKLWFELLNEDSDKQWGGFIDNTFRMNRIKIFQIYGSNIFIVFLQLKKFVF